MVEELEKKRGEAEAKASAKRTLIIVSLLKILSILQLNSSQCHKPYRNTVVVSISVIFH